MAIKVRTCPICGAFFETSNKEIYCSDECRVKANKEKSRERSKEYKSSKKASKKEVAAKQRQKSLEASVKRASELGISYGKLKAMEYMRNMELGGQM